MLLVVAPPRPYRVRCSSLWRIFMLLTENSVHTRHDRHASCGMYGETIRTTADNITLT
jgi:hypothetical protein